MNNVDHYTYRVFWSAEDGENVGVCAEFPGLSHLANDPTHALVGIRDLVSSVVKNLRKAKKEVPQALGAQKFSGHLHVRLPPNVHRELAFLAQESGMSLNRVIVDRLAGGAFVGKGAEALAKKAHLASRAPVTKKAVKAARSKGAKKVSAVL